MVLVPATDEVGAVVTRADAARYQAKAAGRDQFVVAPGVA